MHLLLVTLYKSVSCNYLKKVLKIKRHLYFVNASYLFTHIRYKGKTYTITAQEPSIHSKKGAVSCCNEPKIYFPIKM